jgi:hypothetical protein
VNQPNDHDEFDQAFAQLWREADAGVRAPAGFEAQLFERIERAPAIVPEPMSWWVRAAGERHVVLALAIAGLLVAWPGWWLEAASPARAGTAELVSWFQLHALPALWPILGPVLAPFATPRVGLALAVSLAPLLAWASYALAGAIARGAARRALGRRA